MNEPKVQLAIWAALEGSSFVLAMLAAYRRIRTTSAPIQRLRRAAEVAVAYGAVMSLAYAALYYIGGTFTLYGSFLFGCVTGGLHFVIIATGLIVVWLLAPWKQ